MTYSYEPSDQTRNNEDGEIHPTPAQDYEHGADQTWSWVRAIHDETDDWDGKGAPLA